MKNALFLRKSARTVTHSLYLTRPRGKSFPREGQSALPSRGLTIFWRIFSRFSGFFLNVWCFLKFFAQLSLIHHVYNNPERKKRPMIFCFLKKILQDVCADVFTRPTLANIVAVPCKRAQHCCATLRRSQNNGNVGTCWVKSLTSLKLCVTSANVVVVPSKRTQVTTLLGPTMLGVVGQQCCVRLHGPLASN